ncbi:MAG: MarR family transcriptional regulator [Bacteroidia bacterium]|nr:MarR family transcriptional regulator [Bacteroidia bacterium]
MDKKCDEWLPLGTTLGIITKKYCGVLSKSLQHLELERYYSVLLLLDNCNVPVSQQYIADYLFIDKASLVRIMNYLVDSGMLDRKPNANNRREYVVTLTAKAKKAIPEIKETVIAVNRNIFKGFTKQDKVSIFELLSRVSKNLDEQPRLTMQMEIKPARQIRKK